MCGSLPAGAVVDRQLRDGGGCESASQHPLQPLPAPLPGAEDGPHEPSLVWKVDTFRLPWTAHQAAGYQVCGWSV